MKEIVLEHQIGGRPGRSKTRAYSRRHIRARLDAESAARREREKADKMAHRWLNQLNTPYKDFREPREFGLPPSDRVMWGDDEWDGSYGL